MVSKNTCFYVLVVIYLLLGAACGQKKRNILGQELFKPAISRNETLSYVPTQNAIPIKRSDEEQIPMKIKQPSGTSNRVPLPPLALPTLPPLEPDDDIFDIPFIPTVAPFPVCGDGIVQPTEQCDDGNFDNLDGCNVICLLPVCGNGAVEFFEQCDDNNNEGEDGCTEDCIYERCGNERLETFNEEQCDDGNLKAGDGCSPCCLYEICGNGVLDPKEECDDGGTNSGDGCSDCCELEGVDDDDDDAGTKKTLTTSNTDDKIEADHNLDPI